MTQLIFVRHAPSDYSVREDALRPLTAAGTQQAQRLVLQLADLTIDAVYSSPFRRTIDTVSPLAQEQGLDIIPLDDLRERAIGTWVEDFSAFAQAQWADFDYALPNGESLRQVQQRMIGVLETLLSREGQTVAVGCHGTALSALLQALFPDFCYRDFERIRDVMPYVVMLTFDGRRLISMRELTDIPT